MSSQTTMDFPGMNLCPDRKRGLNSFFMFSRSKNATVNKVPNMFGNNGVVFQTANNCQSDYINNKSPKIHGIFEKSYNQSAFPLTSFSIVGGFLGSKSQVRSSVNQDQCVWDFIKFAENLYNASTDIIRPYFKDHFASNSVPSPPKKKFVKEEPQHLETSEKDFPSVDEKTVCTPVSAPLDCSKQSYAEVAKSVCPRPATSSGSNQLSASQRENSVMYDSRQKRHQRRNNFRKRNRRDRRNHLSQSAYGTLGTVPESMSIDLKAENLKSSKTAACPNRVFDATSMKNETQSSLQRQSRESSCKSLFGCAHREEHPHYRSGIGRKRPAKSRSSGFDIAMVNWRTGEPIKPNMPSGSVMDCPEKNKPEAMEGGNIHLHDELDYSSSKFGDHSSESSPATEQQFAQTCSRRRSFSSECSVDSEDSFIVFQSGAMSDSLSDVSSNWSDCDSDDSYDDDSDSILEVDFCDGYSLSPSCQRLQEVNLRWECESMTPVVPEGAIESSRSRNKEIKKKVQFTPSKPKVHLMLAWDYAYRSSRVGPWEVMARDRARFQSRIQQFEILLSPVLSPDHRAKIWNRLQSPT